MKKVGLVTCYMDNYGACLQAYALQKSINKAGFHCEIIKYTPIKSSKDYGFLINVGIWLRNHLKSFNNVVYKYDNYRHARFKSFRKKYLCFSKENYLSEKKLYLSPPDYDIFVTGSDQIWNPNLYDGKNNRVYFLDFVPDDKKRIAYAPSIGISSISKECALDMKKLISKFDFVSIRESDGKRIIDEICDCECRVVLDPTLLISKEEWESIIGERIIHDNYILLYLFGDREYTKEFVQYVYNQLGLKVVTIPFNKREYESEYYKIKKAGPLDFVNLIKYASLVITDSFHATAFSINLNVPFYTLLRNDINDKNNMNSRIYSILNICGLEQRMIASKDDFPVKISLDLDFTLSNHNIIEKRQNDVFFLNNALENVK